MVNIKDVMALNSDVAVSKMKSSDCRRKLFMLLMDPDFDQYWNNRDPTKNIVTLDRIQLVIVRVMAEGNAATTISKYDELQSKYHWETYAGTLSSEEKRTLDAFRRDAVIVHAANFAFSADKDADMVAFRKLHSMKPYSKAAL